MNEQISKNIIIASCIFIMLVGVCVLIGWAYDIQMLKSVIPNEATMKSNTAVCMILSALSIFYLISSSPILYFAGIAQSLMVICVACVTLLQYFTQLNFGLDEFLFKDTSNLINPGRMSPTTAFCFLCISFAVIMLESSRKRIYFRNAVAAALSSTVVIITGLVLISYLPYLILNYRLFEFTNMSIHTSLLFVLMASSLLLHMRSERNLNWTLNASITIGCAVWLLALLLLSFAYYSFMIQIKKSNDELIYSQEVTNEVNNILITVVNLSASKRNDAITNEELLARRAKSKNELYQYFNNIDKLTKDRKNDQILSKELRSLIDEKIDLLEKSENTYQISAQESIVNNRIVEIFTQLRAQENKIFNMQKTKQNILFNHGLLLSPLGIFLSIAMLCGGLFILNYNIFERRKITAKRKQLSEIVESSDDAIIGKSLDSVITSWNAGAEHIFGYSANEAIGQSILMLIPPERIDEETKIINKIKNGEKIDHFETVRKRKDGKHIDVSVTVSPIKNEKNEIIGASKFVRDITERKQLELQLHQGQKMSAIGQLTGGVAHDFNNLLGIILGNLDLLARNLSTNEEALKRVNNALNAATRGAELTKRMLSFSRMQRLNPTPTFLANSVNVVAEMAKKMLGENIQIVTNIDAAIPPIMVDATELESALLNLAVNARDAMPKGGKIIFSAKLLDLDNNYVAVQAGDVKPGAYACVSVTDSGEGIPPDVLERVFEPFFTTKPKGKGTGMGLSMVYGFIKQSGGVIRIYSEVGQGTKISLYLPFSENLEIKPEQIKKEIINQQFTGKVLAVDDETDLLDITSNYLKDMGFEVLYAIDGQSALDIFSKNRDIIMVVTDINMPGGMTGIDLAKKIRQIDPEMLVIYTSGFSQDLIADKSMHLEEILITKPYSRDVFMDTISKAINAHQSNKSIKDNDDAK